MISRQDQKPMDFCFWKRKRWHLSQPIHSIFLLASSYSGFDSGPRGNCILPLAKILVTITTLKEENCGFKNERLATLQIHCLDQADNGTH